MPLDREFQKKLNGTLDDILKKHLEAEYGDEDGDLMQVDSFINDFEDEYPRNPDEPAQGAYPTYSDEALRAAREFPYGVPRNERPKVWELNQAPAARIRGWRIIDLYPNRDKKDEFYRLAGTPAELRMMTQTTRHTHEMVNKMSGPDITLEEWFKEWQSGWTGLTDRTHPTLRSNYPPADRVETDSATGVSVVVPRWRSIDTQPEFIEWKSATSAVDLEYRVIEYFPDKSIPGESVVFSGTDREIIEKIQGYEWTKEVRYANSLTPLSENQPQSFKGFPQIVLYFTEIRQPGSVKSVPYSRQLAFRLIGYTERWDLVDAGKTNSRKLTSSLIREIANRIILNFGGPNNYKYTSGKNVISYRDKPNGIETYNLCQNESAGTSIMANLCNVVGIPMDFTKLKYTETIDPDGAYPDIAPDINIMGKIQKARARRVTANFQFTHSMLRVASAENPFNLTNQTTITFDDSELDSL